jgi:hypothetical protein
MPLEVSHARMNDAASTGIVASLGQGFPWIARYLNAWWVEFEGGWLRVTDAHVAAELDDVASRLAETADRSFGGASSAESRRTGA